MKYKEGVGWLKGGERTAQTYDWIDRASTFLFPSSEAANIPQSNLRAQGRDHRSRFDEAVHVGLTSAGRDDS